MPNVYAFPPVGIVGHEWSVSDPVSRSRSALTARRYMSRAAPRRRICSLVVSSRALGSMGAGYMEVLKRLLEGGVHLVRINSLRINYRDVLTPEVRASAPLTWLTGADPLAWQTGASPLAWFTGTVLTGTPGTSGGFDILTVTGLPPSALVTQPGEFVTVFEAIADTSGATIMVMAPAWSDASGVAVIRLMEAAPYAARVNLGAADSAVFEALELPRSRQPARGDWTWEWEFREVFEAETEGFTEIDPWA